MANSSTFHFLIEHIDPLGQGVFKTGENIFFIPKTLPMESGLAVSLKRKKGVHFAQLQKLEKSSEQRISPACSHFEQCPGCHYLHCSYESELSFKTEAFHRMLKPITQELTPQVIRAQERLGYRNRIQLHYNKKLKKLGFIQALNNRIVEVPHCLITTRAIKQEMAKLYHDQAWLEEIKNGPPTGHVELYDRDGVVQKSWNKKYAHGGFTQVNQQMNEKLAKLITSKLTIKKDEILLDLFGGNGNLSDKLTAKKYVIDYYTRPQRSENFLHLDLMQAQSLDQFKNLTSLQKVDFFLIDPPRKGFEHIGPWAKALSPEKIIYVSCHPQTMIRDLKSLIGYQLKEVFLLDLFPGTFHFEACAFLEKTSY